MFKVMHYENKKLNIDEVNVFKNSDHEVIWVDICKPQKEEMMILKEEFDFHPLAVEDCLNEFQRPKVEIFDDHVFIILHSTLGEKIEFNECNIFLSDRYIVTIHNEEWNSVNELCKKLEIQTVKWSTFNIFYELLDLTVDKFFSYIFQIEDIVNDLEINVRTDEVESLLGNLIEIRGDIAKLRRSILPMKEMVYKLMNTSYFNSSKHNIEYLTNIYSHLVFLSEVVEEMRNVTSDIRENYLSFNAHHLNHIMKTLTVITTLFMPLTFIAGIYGMNFRYIPELSLRYGYFAVLFMMITMSIGMVIWFKKKGWF